MHTSTLKKLALALIFWLTLHASYVKAQILGPLGTTPYTFEVDSNGLLSATGSYGSGTLSLSGAGARMFWYPGKAAFRAGYLDTTVVYPDTQDYWNDSNIGVFSVAFGRSTEASGAYSLAAGRNSTASGAYSVALGGSLAANDHAVALGASDAYGSRSTALSESDALGDYSFAAGQSQALGYSSTAIGTANSASGYSATALGSSTTASGYYSTASGFYTQATSYSSFVTGFYNLGTNSSGAVASATTWVSTDPLFEIGNGGVSGGPGNPAVTGRSDAFVVYKNGNAVLQGSLQVAPTGDIPMYTGD